MRDPTAADFERHCRSRFAPLLDHDLPVVLEAGKDFKPNEYAHVRRGLYYVAKTSGRRVSAHKLASGDLLITERSADA